MKNPNNYAEIDWNEIQKKIHDRNVKQGFHDKNEPSEIEYRCLIIEEILEAYRAFDEGTPPVYFNVASGEIDPISDPKEYLEFITERNINPKPEGYAVELVDVVMRCLDYLTEKEINYKYVSMPVSTNPDLFILDIMYNICFPKVIINKILSFFEYKGWGFYLILTLKMRYNTTRPYRHGMKGKE